MRMTIVKILIAFLLVPGFLVLPGTGSISASSTVAAADSAGADQVVVYQFHRRFRCPSCHDLEALIAQTLKTHYPGEIESGNLVFRVLNLDDKNNKHFIKDYDLLYNTVIIADIKGGREVRFKNLEKIWEIYEDEEKAAAFLRSEIDEYLKDK